MSTDWSPVTLGQLATYTNGRGFKKSEWKEKGIPIIRIQNLTGTNEKLNYYSGPLDAKHSIVKGDLLLSWAATLDVYEFQEEVGALNQHIFKVEPNKDVNKKFLYYLLKNVLAELHAKTHGSGMVHITAGAFKNTAVKLPPLDQQQKIVAKLEELLSDLQGAKIALRTAKIDIGLYKQSVLNSLFAGKKSTQLGSIVRDVRYGTSKKCGSDRTLTPVLRIPNIVNGTIEHRDLKYASFNDAEKAKLSVKLGDLLVIRSNGSPSIVGKCAEVTEKDQGFLFAGYLIRLRFNPAEHSTRFYKYLLSSPKLREQIELKAKSTSGVNNINSDELRSLSVPLMSLDEQVAIVNILDEKTSETDSLHSAIAYIEKEINILQTTILTKAFEGELK